MKTTAAEFSRMLPTLQHVARFPTANRARLCARDGVTFVELEAMLFDLTDGSPSIWDEDCVAELAAKFGVKLTPYDPGARPAMVAAAKPTAPKSSPSTAATRAGDAEGALVTLKLTPSEARRRVEHAVAQLGHEATTEQLVKFAIKNPAPRPAPTRAPRADNQRPRKTKAAKPIKPQFLAVCRLLLADESLSESAACKRADVKQSTWAYFKSTRLGEGALDRKKLEALAGVLIERGTPHVEKPTKRAYTRRRLSKTTAAPAGAAAQPAQQEKRLAALPPPMPLAPCDTASAGKSMLAGLLLAQLTGASTTADLGNFRLELDLRLVPINQGGPSRD